MNESLVTNNEWYTIEELAELTGYSAESLRSKAANNPLAKLDINFDIEAKSVGREHRKFYSANVFKALKEYQIKNSVPNALKDKQTALEGNMAYLKQEFQNQLVDTPVVQEWYTIEELAELTGYSSGNALMANPNTASLLNQFNSENDVKKVGSAHKKFYSANVLKVLKEYQIKNGVPNALKDKQTALEGNVSYVQQDTFQKTMAKVCELLEQVNKPKGTDEQVHLEKARMYKELGEKYKGECNGLYTRVMDSYVTKELSGEFLLPLPETQKSYTATEIGKILGISRNMVGKITNENNLKTEQYGFWGMDKKLGSDGLVPNFRYYEDVIPVIRECLTCRE